MADGPRKEERRGISCSPETCQYHDLTESVITDLKEAVHKLMEGQDMMRGSLIQMTEAFKAVERLEDSLRKLEEEVRFANRGQDKKIDSIRVFMYKAIGAASAAAAILTYLSKSIGD